MRNKTILDLCGGTGSWSKPYADKGYFVIVVDPEALPEANCVIRRQTVREFLDSGELSRLKVHGILAAPPCTHFSGSGARWWKQKDASGETEEAVKVVRDCLEVIHKASPAWWCLENPVGRIAKLVPELGDWVCTFNPCDYGDPYTKRTCLWGNFNVPPMTPVPPTEGSKLWRLPPSPDRWRLRSMTPQGFAQAFCNANP